MTFHTTYRSPKFFICVHVTHHSELQFESAVNRHTFYTYVVHGKGIYCCFDGKNAETFEFLEEKKLFDLRKYTKSSIVGTNYIDSEIISFNPWRKNENWDGKLLDKDIKTVKSDKDYACLVCFEGNFNINGKEVPKLSYVNLIKGKEYPIEIRDSYVGMFELL